MAEYLSKKDALASVNGLFAQKQTNSFNSGFEEAAQRTAASLKKFEQQQTNKSVQPIVTPQMPKATTRQPTPQQTANYNKLQELVAKSNPIQTNTQALASGRDFAVMPNVETGGRIGAGLKSIGQSAKAALPMLGSTAAQAAENVAAAADSKDYAAKRAQLFMLQNGLSNIPEYNKRKAAEEEAKTALQNVVDTEQLNKPVSPDSVGMQMMGKAKEYQRQAVEGLSPTGQFIGNTLISIGQNAAMLPTAAINPSLPLVGMGAIAAADKAYELSEQGVGAGEALTRGIAAGGIEALTEKIPLDNLLKMAKTPAGKSILETLIKQSGKQAAGESIEEAVSYALNYAADALARDPNAKFSWQDLGMAALGGAVSGGVMGGGASAFGSYVNNAQPVARVQDSVQIENPANSQTIENVQGGKSSNKVKANLTLFNPEVLKNNNLARRFFYDYAKSIFPKSVINKNTGREIGIPSTGLSKLLSGNIKYEKYASAFHVPELIENAVKVSEAQNYHEEKRDQIPTYDYYDSPIDIGDKSYTAHIRVKNTTMGDKYYGHTVSEIDEIKIEPSARTFSEKSEVQPVNAFEDSIDLNIPQVGNEVNNSIVLNEQGNAQPVIDTDLDESIEALMYDIDANEMARRARAAAKAPNEKTAELLSNTSNGIIESDSIDDSAQLLGKVSFAANKTISQVLDQAARGSKGDLPLNKQQMQQLRNNLYNAIEKPLNEAKAKYINGIKSKAGNFAKDMARLGIKPGSKESAAVQWIGEGQRQGPDGEVIEYTLADLQQQFPNNWQNIVEASKVCRNIYDAYVNEINDALKLVYPDVEARAAATMDKINARVAYNTNQAQIWLDKAAQLEQRLSAAQAETHGANSMAATKTADRVNRLANQLEAANQTVERYTRAAEAARAKAEDLQRMISSGEILRNKRLVPRKDYFHHFNEMEQGLGGFVNIISGAHDISAQLAGKSEFTKPKSKWWSALQQRTGGKYTEDAIGGMARYIPAAEYKIAFDPFIARMRGNVEALVNATEKTKNANDLIEYLTDWTNDLAGKTNFLDRPFQKLFSRKSMKALEFLNNRAKANAVAGNLGSAIVQIGNIPNAMMFINNPADWASAAQDIATGNSKEGQSIFLNERYIGNTLDKLQKSSPIKDASNWMLEIGDRQAAKLIWNAAYNQFESGRAKGLRQYENAVDYADDITRRAIAGRGVGEMALTQKSRVIKLFAPFQVEVNNTYNLLVEKMGEKDAAALMSYAVGAWAINSLLYVITGRRALFDPIDALIDAIKGMRDEDEEDERTKGERVAGAISRVGGEVISNMPYASTAATFLTGTENSEKIFGEADPTRYGTGNIAVQTLTEPIGQFINGEKVDLLGPATAILPAYGGKQIERTVRGAQTLGYLPRVDISSGGVDIDRNEFGASRSASGRIRFPITEPADQFKTMLFGEWGTSRGKDYIDKGLQPLSDKQSEAMEKAFAAGISPDTYYDALLAARNAVSQKDAKGKTIPLSQDRDKIRLIKEAVPGLTSKEYKLLFEALGISKNAY
jgi:hypothetical protein